MSTNGDRQSQTGYDARENQTSYIFTPVTGEEEPKRPTKRRKISKGHTEAKDASDDTTFQFCSLLNGTESATFVAFRQKLFKTTWAETESRVQAILEDANERTLGEVTLFVNQDLVEEHRDQIPTGLIVTGPNVASQELLFNQISDRLKSETNSLVITLRSMDAPNLKTALKKLIRAATNEKGDDEDEAHITTNQSGRKLLNYDLQILQDHLGSSNHSNVVVAFQDSEAFDNGLLAELLVLLRSWLDRIPFVVLFGIATSVELFHERLPAAAIRCLHGAQFDVEQTSKTLEKVFQRVVADIDAPLRLGAGFMSSVLERQHDHVQSLQTFIGALKYAYMCHFYANPSSIFLGYFGTYDQIPQPIQGELLDAVRMLPSFRRRIEQLLQDGHVAQVRLLLDSNEDLCQTIETTLRESRDSVTILLKNLEILAILSSVMKGRTADRMDFYVKAFAGQLAESAIVTDIIASIQTLSPDEVVSLIQEMLDNGHLSRPDSLPMEARASNHELQIVDTLTRIQSETKALRTEASTASTPLRSKYGAENKSLRTTVVAQKVQLSREKSTLSDLDVSFTKIIDEISEVFTEYFEFLDPQSLFLHEIWLYDMKSPNREVFTPKPRHAIERALSNPHDYLNCTCCRPSQEGLSSSQPPTAILYQLYLETGGLINVYDLWSAFYTILGGEEEKDCDERTALVLFYRALSDLRLLGMVKQSRKKTDHLAKLAWKGL